jgi:protease II
MTAVTREHKDQALERIKSDPFVKRLGFERLERWVILTLEGTDAGRADLPPVDDAPFLATLNGVNYHTIHNGHLYVIRNNERADDWELLVERIK